MAATTVLAGDVSQANFANPRPAKEPVAAGRRRNQSPTRAMIGRPQNPHSVIAVDRAVRLARSHQHHAAIRLHGNRAIHQRGLLIGKRGPGHICCGSSWPHWSTSRLRPKPPRHKPYCPSRPKDRWRPPPLAPRPPHRSSDPKSAAAGPSGTQGVPDSGLVLLPLWICRTRSCRRGERIAIFCCGPKTQRRRRLSRGAAAPASSNGRANRGDLCSHPYRFR